jgi:hypothetical protein
MTSVSLIWPFASKLAALDLEKRERARIVQLVERPDHGVAETESGYRELNRHEGVAFSRCRTVKAGAIGQRVLDDAFVADVHEIVIDDHVLIGPACELSRAVLLGERAA